MTPFLFQIKNKTCISTGLAIILSFILTSTNLVFASGSFVALPANPNMINQNRFIVEARPGESVTEHLYLENTSTKEQTFKIYAVDAELKENTKYIAKTINEQQKELGAWTTLEKPTVTLKPNEKITVPFVIAPPSDVNLKEYLGGIAIQADTTPEAQDSENGIAVNTRVILRIDLKVTNDPHQPERLFKEKSFWEKINKTHLFISGVIFLISAFGLILTRSKENSSKRAKLSRGD